MNQVELRSTILECSQLWEMSELPGLVKVEFSQRMKTSLGRCLPERGIIRLNNQLKSRSRAFVREVLCHELAHFAIHLRYGTHVRPHGVEWRRLIELAGYEPKCRVLSLSSEFVSTDRGAVDSGSDAHIQRCRPKFEHRCPVCQSVRLAATSARRWRCAECVADGLNGELVISQVAGREPRRE